jgi:monoamine oxidase
MDMVTDEHADVIVVGAGFAGLSAAYKLQSQGMSVVVLEARERSGGRTLSATMRSSTAPSGKADIDLGAQWAGPKQLKINQLIKEFDLATIPTYSEGKDLTRYDKLRTDTTPPAAQILFDRIDQLGNQLPLRTPWEHWNAVEWDRMTFASWLERETSDISAANLVARGVAGGLLAGDAGDYSMLQVLFYVASGGGIASLMDCNGGAQDFRIVGGSQTIAHMIARKLGSPTQYNPDEGNTGSIRYNQPVRHIVHNVNKRPVCVYTDDSKYYANHVVLAIPPTLAGRINYQPILPPARDGLMQRMAAGYALKVHVFYKTPFWREAGWSGCALTDQGVVAETFDNSPPDGSFYDLVVFVYGREAQLLRTKPPSLQSRIIIEDLVQLYGPKARDVDNYLSFDWTAEEWTRGCFSGHLAPNGWIAYGPALRTPVGRIHWAGTETATEWNGYLDGAIESGWRAASEILAAAP